MVIARNYRAPKSEAHVVGMERQVGTREVLPRVHSLIIEKVRGGTVVPVGAGFGGKNGLQSGSAAVLARKGVDLDTGFLDGIRLGGQIQHALANSASHVESIHDVLIVVLALTVGAGIDLLFGGEVVHA